MSIFFSSIVFGKQARNRYFMYHHIKILRVLQDRTTSAVVHVCDSNAVLKVDFGNIDSQSLKAGDIVLICVKTYNPPFLCANIQHKLANGDLKEAIPEETISEEEVSEEAISEEPLDIEEQYLSLEAQEAATKTLAKTPRKRMCFY